MNCRISDNILCGLEQRRSTMNITSVQIRPAENYHNEPIVLIRPGAFF